MDFKGIGPRTDIDLTAGKLDQFKALQDLSQRELDPLGGKHRATDKEIKSAGQQFEALLMQSMFKAMWSTVPQDGLLSGGNEAAMYRDMFNEALAKDLAEKGTIGIADVIVKDITRLEKK